jgi:hypothetical protein
MKMIYLNKNCTKWKSMDKQLVITNNLYDKAGKSIKCDIFTKPRIVKNYEQMGNYTIANFAGGYWSSDFELVK